jgi:hypothetical protein
MWRKIEGQAFVYRFLVPSIDADSMRKQRTENFSAYLHFSDNDGNRVEPISQGLSPEMPKEVRNLGRGSRRCSRRSPRTFPAVGPGGADGDPVRAKTGIPWEYLPAKMGCGSGMTCWRRLHQMLLEELARADRID